MKRGLRFQILGLLLVTGLVVTGCKSVPELTQADAQKLLQAYYEQQPATTIIINVDQNGIRQGVTAKYWKLTKAYPNNRWADLDLTDDGKKVLTLNGGGNTIQWRPDEQGKGHFYVTTVAATHPLVKEVSDPQDDVVPGVETAKSCKFTEEENFKGVPDPLSQIAHNPGNVVTSRKTADFALENGAWKVHSVR